MYNKFSARLLRVVLNLVFLFYAMLALAGLSGVFNLPSDLTLNKILLGILAIMSAIAYLMLAICLSKILDSSYQSIFVNENVKRFKKMGYCLVVTFLADYIATAITGGPTGTRMFDLAPGVFITPSMLVQITPALTCFIISDAFTKAIKIKEENDLTI